MVTEDDGTEIDETEILLLMEKSTLMILTPSQSWESPSKGGQDFNQHAAAPPPHSWGDSPKVGTPDGKTLMAPPPQSWGDSPKVSVIDCKAQIAPPHSWGDLPKPSVPDGKPHIDIAPPRTWDSPKVSPPDQAVEDESNHFETVVVPTESPREWGDNSFKMEAPDMIESIDPMCLPPKEYTENMLNSKLNHRIRWLTI